MGKGPKRVSSPSMGAAGLPPLKKARNPLLNQNKPLMPKGNAGLGGMSQLASRLLAAQPAPQLPKQPMPLGAMLPTEPEPPVTTDAGWPQPAVELKEEMDELAQHHQMAAHAAAVAKNRENSPLLQENLDSVNNSKKAKSAAAVAAAAVLGGNPSGGGSIGGNPSN